MKTLTPDQLRQNAAAMIAFADGKPIEWITKAALDVGRGCWAECSNPDWDKDFLYRPKPEPKVRAWNCPADVPLNCWLRSCRNPDEVNALVVSVSSKGIEWFTNSDRFLPWNDARWTYLEYSTDRREWKPCTVEEA